MLVWLALAFAAAADALRVPASGIGRRELLAKGGATAAFAPVFGHSVALAAAPDYAGAKAALKEMIVADPDIGPTMVRLAWHSSGTYDMMTKTGGSGGGTIRFKEELAHGGNAGLDKMVAKLEPVKTAFPAVSYADLYTLAGATALEAAGVKVPWKAGRKDALSADAVTPDGRLPDASKGNDPKKTAAALRMDVFYRMGFNDQEIVALSGAHALGRCHPDASGYSGPWSPTPTILNNGYFNLLLAVPWTIKEWEGPMQFEDPSGKLMMLPSDMVLIQDKAFRPFVKMYAKDNALFVKDFTAAYTKLTELGTKGLKAVDI
jgi:cytochrome c peroxidase